jgi:hypothetical protein
MEEIRFEDNPVLFGSDTTPGIVAAELAGRFIRLFVRNDRGVFFHDEPFHPFILLERPELLEGFAGEVSITPLSGGGELRFSAVFRDWQDCIKARDYLSKKSGKTASSPEAPYQFISDPVHQHLLLSGKTLFKDLEFSKLHRLAIDIETFCQDGLN